MTAEWQDIVNAQVAAEAPPRMGLFWGIRDQGEAIRERACPLVVDYITLPILPNVIGEVMREPHYIHPPMESSTFHIFVTGSVAGVHASIKGRVKLTDGVTTNTGSTVEIIPAGPGFGSGQAELTVAVFNLSSPNVCDIVFEAYHDDSVAVANVAFRAPWAWLSL